MLANLANMLLTCKLMDTKVLRCRRQHVGQVAGDTGAWPRARPVRQPPCESATVGGLRQDTQDDTSQHLTSVAGASPPARHRGPTAAKSGLPTTHANPVSSSTIGATAQGRDSARVENSALRCLSQMAFG